MNFTIPTSLDQLEFTVPSELIKEYEIINNKSKDSSDSDEENIDSIVENANLAETSSSKNQFSDKSFANILGDDVFGKKDNMIEKCNPIRNDNVDEEIQLLNECEDVEEFICYYQLIQNIILKYWKLIRT
jgi:hypothetical protein